GADTFVMNKYGTDKIMDTAADLNGTRVSSFGALDQIDLTDVAFGPHTTLGFSASRSSDKLTISDGTHTAAITLLGQYTASQFKAVSDGRGGRLVEFAQQNQSMLASSHH